MGSASAVSVFDGDYSYGIGYGGFANPNANGWQLYKNSSETYYDSVVGGHHFLVSNSEKVTISGNGLVGIGTTAPGAKLHVMGDVLTPTGSYLSPYGGIGRYENLLTYTEAFDNAAWVKSASTTTPATNLTAPDGDADAESITFADLTSTADTIKQDANVTAASTQFTGSVWLKVASGTLNVRLGVIDEAGTPAGTYATAALTTTWQRFSVSHTFAAGATGTANFLLDDNANTVSQTLHAWGAQLESAVGTPGVYVRTTTTPVTAGIGAVSNGAPTGSGDALVANPLSHPEGEVDEGLGLVFC